MGSFNTSCFVSQQTIAPDDEAIIIPIMQQTTYNPVELNFSTHEGVKEVAKYGYCNSICYPTAFWGYAGPMLKGKYDDYGRFNLNETKENEDNLISFFNSLSESVCDVKQGENKSHDIPLNFHNLYSPEKEYSFSKLIKIWNSIWDVAGESRLFVRNYKNEPMPMAFAVMHQCVGDYLINELSKGTLYNGESLELKSYFHSYVNKNFVNKMKYFTMKQELEGMIDFIVEDMASLRNFYLGEQEGTDIGRFYKGNDSFADKFTEYAKNNADKTVISKEFSDELFEHFKTQIEHRYIANQLSGYDIKLAPMVYAGQDYDNSGGDSYLKLIRASNKLVKQMLKDKKAKSKFSF